jgi:hypothetical protein
MNDSLPAEIYPMPFFALLVADSPVDLATWYVDALGFFRLFETAGFSHLRRHKYQDILVTPAGLERVPTTGGPYVYLDADGELETLAAHLRDFPRSGSMGVSGPVQTPWNTCELRITDPVGHRLVMTSRPANPDPEIAERTRAMLKATSKT